MNNKKGMLWNVLRITLTLFFGIWMLVGVVAGLYNNFHATKTCVENEGLVRGIAFCSTGGMTQFTKNMFLGILWPALFFQSPRSEDSVNDPSVNTQKQFYDSAVGTMYTCWGIADETKRDEDKDTLWNTIEWMKSNHEAMRNQHISYVYMTALKIVRLTDDKALESFYRERCVQPIKNLRNEVDSGALSR